MPIGYTKEKLHLAVDSLVRAGSIQDRLRSAAFPLTLLQGGLAAPAFPNDQELQGRLDRVIDSLTSTPAVGDEGTIAASTRAMTNEDAESLALEIFSLFYNATDLGATR